MGVTDRPPRTVIAQTVPSPDEIERIRESVADTAQIRIEIETVVTSNGAVIVVRIPDRPRGVPFHTHDGKYLIRLDDKLRGMTLEELDAIRREAGSEFTSAIVPDDASRVISAAAFEELRRLMAESGAETDLAAMSDSDLLKALGVVSTDGRLLVAGLLLIGKPEAIRRHVPHAQWRFFRMKSDTEYDQADNGYDCLPVALRRLRELINANNPITTVPGDLLQPEFPRYPNLAMRELLVNAFAHRDYQIPGTVVAKIYPSRLELSSPGGFVGGVTPGNILHHPSAPRNTALFSALARFRLANASNLGVPRIYRDLLSEGKEPPAYTDEGQTVQVMLKGQEVRREFLRLVNDYPGLGVDHLLVIHYLTRHREVNAARAAQLSQRPLETARELLGFLSTVLHLLQQGGSGKGRYFRLSRAAYEILTNSLEYHIDMRLTEGNVRARILETLKERSLTNAELREITQYSRDQCLRIMKKLEQEGMVQVRGTRKSAQWFLRV
jgi:ATP-dependent DNA helicase RecG